MKINDASSNSAINNLSVEKALNDKNSAAKTNTDKAVNSTETKPADSVTLSAMAQQIKNIGSNVGTDKVFDAAKVNEIKAAIETGQFKVNTETVADGLIASVKDMLIK